MRDVDRRALDILSDLGHRPAAPFFEEGPAQLLMDGLGAIHGVDAGRDAFGNISTVAGAVALNLSALPVPTIHRVREGSPPTAMPG